MEFTRQDHLARHEDEQHHLRLLHAVDQACTADAVRARTVQTYEVESRMLWNWHMKQMLRVQPIHTLEQKNMQTL